jgi:DNA-binding NtrC family response regulator
MGHPVKGWTELIANAPKTAEILIVEDDPDVRRLTRTAVEELGYSVKSASSAEEADSWMESAEFDLILLDIDLPRMNGVEFLKWALNREPDLSVIMLTGHTEPELAMACLDLGARTFLVKPLDIDILERAVRDALILRALLQDRNRLAGP